MLVRGGSIVGGSQGYGIFLYLGKELFIILAIPSSDLIVKLVICSERVTCGSLVVILTEKNSSCSCMLSSIIETVKHTRVSS